MLRQSAFRSAVFVSLVLGSTVGILVFGSALAMTLYLTVTEGSPGYVVLFFGAGFPVFSGVSGLVLGFTARWQAARGTSVGLCVIALYSLVFTGVVAFLVVYLFYGSGS